MVETRAGKISLHNYRVRNKQAWGNGKKYRRRRRAFLLFLLPSLAGVTLFVLLPFLDVVKRSFQTAVTGEFTGGKKHRPVYGGLYSASGAGGASGGAYFEQLS